MIANFTFIITRFFSYKYWISNFPLLYPIPPHLPLILCFWFHYRKSLLSHRDPFTPLINIQYVSDFQFIICLSITNRHHRTDNFYQANVFMFMHFYLFPLRFYQFSINDQRYFFFVLSLDTRLDPLMTEHYFNLNYIFQRKSLDSFHLHTIIERLRTFIKFDWISSLHSFFLTNYILWIYFSKKIYLMESKNIYINIFLNTCYLLLKTESRERERREE